MEFFAHCLEPQISEQGIFDQLPVMGDGCFGDRVYYTVAVFFKINKLLSKLPLILLCTIWIDDSLFDCRVLPQQGRNGATGSGTWVGARPLWCQCGMARVFPKSQ
jgi:hypothetical protein